MIVDKFLYKFRFCSFEVGGPTFVSIVSCFFLIKSTSR